MASVYTALAVLFFFLIRIIEAINVDVNSTESVKNAVSTVAHDLVSYYKGNESGQIPGLLPEPYYWWEAGAMFGALVSYRHYTGDTTYDAITTQALQFQVGPYNDYRPPNQTATLGNDDQAFWAMAALAAAETNYPNPPDPKDPSWLALAQAVFNEQTGLWDTSTCNGGIRWQITITNSGYDLKNSISNGCLFNIASRLARYTGDDNYAQWAVKVWDWMARIGLIDDNFHVYDNSEAVRLNCTQLDRNQWSYNAGTMLMGASTMYNYTNGDPVWRNRTAGLLATITADFFPNNIMREGCEDIGSCNVDQLSFKAYLSRWMAQTTQMAPFTFTQIDSLLKISAQAAAQQCTGGPSGSLCGKKWRAGGQWDGTDGVGQEMTALEVLLGTMIGNVPPPVTAHSGGNSTSVPTAGHNASASDTEYVTSPSSRGDRGGAWFLTTLIVLSALWSTWFMMSTAWESKSTIAGVEGGKSERKIMVLDLKGKASSQLAGIKPDSRTSAPVLPPSNGDEAAMARDVEKGDAVREVAQEGTVDESQAS